MGRESLSANSEANSLWELTPRPLEKSVPSLVLSIVDIFPFQKLFISLCFSCNSWTGPKSYWARWDDLIYDSGEISFQLVFESETFSNSKINCDRKYSPCQMSRVMLS